MKKNLTCVYQGEKAVDTQHVHKELEDKQFNQSTNKSKYNFQLFKIKTKWILEMDKNKLKKQMI